MFAALGLLTSVVLLTLSPLLWAHWGVAWMTIVISAVAVPLLDAMVGVRAPVGFGGLAPRLARWIPRVQLPTQAALLVTAASWAQAMSWTEVAVFALAVGTATGGIGITVAHELGHRPSRLDRAIAKALLVSVGYGHFFVEHTRGHHVRVATADDPATAPRGMNVYRFILRSVVLGLVHAWQLESLRMARRGRSAWHPSNWVVTGSLLSAAALLLAGVLLGAKAAALLAGQAVVGVMLLEIVNYIEHYGLRRVFDGQRHEPVQPHHSWNADHTVSNWLLLNLQRHSDHHAHIDRPYESLRTMPTAPQLPAGYPTMVLVALLPPLWRAVIDSRLPAETSSVPTV